MKQIRKPYPRKVHLLMPREIRALDGITINADTKCRVEMSGSTRYKTTKNLKEVTCKLCLFGGAK